MIRAGLAAILVAAFANVLPAWGQLMLPGAVHAPPPRGSGEASNDAGSADAGQARPKPAKLQAPSETTVVGRDLSRDGFQGVIAFKNGAAKGLEISSLSFAGETISSPAVPCRVDVVAGTPIEAKFSGRPGGLSRYAVEIAACPFSFDVLEGAVLVTRDPKACTFAAADCRVDPTGLWGPRGDSIEERQIKQWERARAQAEAGMRASFRALLAGAGKDRDAIKRIASEQAGFSSERSVACSTYAGEDLHGFCALRLTEARAIALQARQGAAAKEKADVDPARSRGQKTTAP